MTKRSTTSRALGLAAVASLSLLTVAGQARAELSEADVVDSRLLLSVSYGFLADFYQDEDASGLNPFWGHGVSFQLGGERCGVVCLGIIGLGSIGVSPAHSGSIGVGPHIGARWGGPSWAGDYHFRFGVAYHWLYTPEPAFDLDNSEITFGDRRGSHGIGAWLALGLDLTRRPGLLTPIIGIRGSYIAAISADPVEHQLSAQVYLGVAIGRRLVFGEGQELEVDEAPPAPSDEDEEIELDEEEERRLREAEDELRR